ncbi:MAG: hypothetical protein IT340_13370 [Chloroflexi bacterium]|nr:hypothetical protein [Chloroflexota bacterium]
MDGDGHDGQFIGGKGAALQALAAAGFPVPPTAYSPTDLAAAVAAIGPPLVVRSSATVEDGSAVSFAGQFHSFLNLQTLGEVRAAVAACRASVDAPSVIDYCRRHGVDHAGVRMGVIVQKMIRPELAGVAFSVNPLTGAEEVVIEAVEGLADRLLLGQEAALPADHPLVVQHRPAIVALARRAQRHFGAPQDIEFAIEQGTLFIVQARPITRIAVAEPGEWTNADFRDGGVASDVCTTLMWWLYDQIWEASLKGSLRAIGLDGPDFVAGRLFFGRPYWNVGVVKARLQRLPGYVERNFDTDLSIEITYDGPGVTTPVTLRTMLGALPLLFKMNGFLRRQEAAARALLTTGFAAIEARCEPVPADPLPGFGRLIDDAYRPTETTYFQTAMATTLAKQDFMQAFPGLDYITLVGGLPPLQHLAPAEALRAMAARGDTDVTLLLTRFRHRGRRELDLCAPRWDEDRAWVEDLLRQARATPPPVATSRAAYAEARARARAALPRWRRLEFDRKLDRLRTFVWLREELRDVSSRIYYHLRRHLLAIAARHDLGDDIFFMTGPEILALDRSEVAARRDAFDGYRTFRPPNELGGPHHGDRPVAPPGVPRGVGASPGVAEGTARVAVNIDDTPRIESGAILVCAFTDPGWTPVLGRVAGVVTETGGLLSHAAVICREFGIPAVLAVPDATRRIRDGERVTVDGHAGTVTLLDRPPAT